MSQDHGQSMYVIPYRRHYEKVTTFEVKLLFIGILGIFLWSHTTEWYCQNQWTVSDTGKNIVQCDFT